MGLGGHRLLPCISARKTNPKTVKRNKNIGRHVPLQSSDCSRETKVKKKGWHRIALTETPLRVAASTEWTSSGVGEGRVSFTGGAKWSVIQRTEEDDGGDQHPLEEVEKGSLRDKHTPRETEIQKITTGPARKRDPKPVIYSLKRRGDCRSHSLREADEREADSRQCSQGGKGSMGDAGKVRWPVPGVKGKGVKRNQVHTGNGVDQTGGTGACGVRREKKATSAEAAASSGA